MVGSCGQSLAEEKLEVSTARHCKYWSLIHNNIDDKTYNEMEQSTSIQNKSIPDLQDWQNVVNE